MPPQLVVAARFAVQLVAVATVLSQTTQSVAVGRALLVQLSATLSARLLLVL